MGRKPVGAPTNERSAPPFPPPESQICTPKFAWLCLARALEPERAYRRTEAAKQVHMQGSRAVAGAGICNLSDSPS
jgi:hypothetical protein